MDVSDSPTVDASARFDVHPAKSVEVAILDHQGVIVSTNQEWDVFCRENHGDLALCGVGVSYLETCEVAADPMSLRIADAIRAAVRGELPAPRTVLVPCNSPVVARWYDVSVSSRFGDDGAALGATVALWQVAAPSARTHLLPLAESALDDTSVWELVEAAPDGTVLVDPEGLIAYVNGQLETLSGYERADLLGRPVEILVPDAVRSHHAALHQSYRAAPRLRMMGRAGVELQLSQRDGTVLPVEISLSPVHIGNTLMTAASIRDVSSQRAADRARQRLLRLLDLDPDAVFIIDADTTEIEYANAGAVSLLGYSRDELTAMTLQALTPSYSKERHQALLDEGEREGTGRRHEVDVIRRARDGSDIPCDSRVQLVEGATRTFIVVDRDARERKALEALKVRHAGVIELVAAVTTMVLTDATPNAVYQRIVEGIAGLLDCEIVSLVLWDTMAGRFTIAAAAGGSDPSSEVDRKAGRVFDEMPVDEATVLSWATREEALHFAEPPEALPSRLRAILGPGLIVRFPGPDAARGILVAFRARDQQAFAELDVEILESYAQQAAVVLALGHARADQQRLALLEDRQRIARDLHDTVIQEVIGVGMQLDAASHITSDPAIRDLSNVLIDQLDETIRRLRTVVFDARSRPVAQSTSEAVRSLVSEAARALGHPPALTVTGDLDALPPAVTEHLIPALREALSNVARHARATETTVKITVVDREIVLTVDDNGCGPGNGTNTGNGIGNLQERAGILAGSAALTPLPGGGSRLTWTARAPLL